MKCHEPRKFWVWHLTFTSSISLTISLTHICIHVLSSSSYSPFGKKPAGGSSSVMPYGGGLAGATAAAAAPAAPAAAAPAPVAAAPAAPAYSSTPAAPAQPAKSYRYVHCSI